MYTYRTYVKCVIIRCFIDKKHPNNKTKQAGLTTFVPDPSPSNHASFLYKTTVTNHHTTSNEQTFHHRSYYKLAAATLRFNFPNPGPLDGITSTTKNILTMKSCGFQYPGSARPQIQGASLKLCLASRVGVTGVNGAGKTTLIKMVVRETEPQTGEVRFLLFVVGVEWGGWFVCG